ncbi:MAG TPA: hypothetical protein ENH82_07725 [bacterium]|nr:hypothetical protein [bacterium]
MTKLIDITGQKFNRLLVIKRAPNRGKRTMWFCCCDCGSEKEIHSHYLISGHTKSCGCSSAEMSAEARKKHGLGKHPIYYVWSHMKDRCYNPKDKGYKNYGGRGISVCEEWFSSLRIFYDFAIARGWKDGLQIDRINNEGNYEPNNCRFITQRENIRNSRTTKLTAREVLDIRSAYANKSFNLAPAELAIAYGVKRGQIYSIINRGSWVDI